MSLLTVQSASVIDVHGATTLEVAGATPLDTIMGLADGQTLLLYSTDYLPLTTSGNLDVVTTTMTPGRPVLFLVRNGVLYEISPVWNKEQPMVNLFEGSADMTEDADMWPDELPPVTCIL